MNKPARSLFVLSISFLAAVMLTATAMRAAPQKPTKTQIAPASEPNTPQTGAQHEKHDAGMPGMNMGDMQKETEQNPEAGPHATAAMSGREMDMGPHMVMTDLRPEQPGDRERAQGIVDTLRQSIARYKDYHVALADGFKIFLPNMPQDQYHFTNYRDAIAAQFKLNPERPTSLLYKKTADGYELEGAMFTAPRRATEDELNKRVPLSVARWHRHVNFCLPRKGVPTQEVDWKQSGAGSIATEEACKQANGRWVPQIFGWMVHVYPFETDPDKVWAH